MTEAVTRLRPPQATALTATMLSWVMAKDYSSPREEKDWVLSGRGRGCVGNVLSHCGQMAVPCDRPTHRNAYLLLSLTAWRMLL